jgi:hypothetical protein
MLQAVRFLAWVAVVLAIGAQATGLGTLGFNLCIERSGDYCSIEMFDQRCCAGDSSESSVQADDRIPADNCDHCVDMPLVLPAAIAAVPTGIADHLMACAITPTLLGWTPLMLRVGVAQRVKLSRSRSPPIPDSLLFAKMIVLRI